MTDNSYGSLSSWLLGVRVPQFRPRFWYHYFTYFCCKKSVLVSVIFWFEGKVAYRPPYLQTTRINLRTYSWGITFTSLVSFSLHQTNYLLVCYPMILKNVIVRNVRMDIVINFKGQAYDTIQQSQHRCIILL